MENNANKIHILWRQVSYKVCWTRFSFFFCEHYANLIVIFFSICFNWFTCLDQSHYQIEIFFLVLSVLFLSRSILKSRWHRVNLYSQFNVITFKLSLKLWYNPSILFRFLFNNNWQCSYLTLFFCANVPKLVSNHSWAEHFNTTVPLCNPKSRFNHSIDVAVVVHFPSLHISFSIFLPHISSSVTLIYLNTLIVQLRFNKLFSLSLHFELPKIAKWGTSWTKSNAIYI